jgi:DNA polymerase
MTTVTNDEQDAELVFSLTRARVERLLAMLDVKRANGGLNADEAKAHEVATLRLFGAGASPKKFARLEAQQVNGVLRDQYRFSGGFQTGRMSSKAAQIQNLTRDVLGDDGVAEAPLVDAIADGCGYAKVAAAEPVDVPVARKLALIVRPALVAAPGKTFVWSDWNAIEARVTPWLANSPDAERVLDIFRANDCDSMRADNYVVAAADIFHKNSSEVTKLERQIGKVVVLACIAEGELVLTDVGLVPIEKVTTAMRLWDGVAWVTHSGVLYKGVRDVFTYDGLTTTADHIVFTTQGELRLSDAAACGARLVRSGTGRTPLRVERNHLSRTALRNESTSHLCRNAVCRMRLKGLDRLIRTNARPLLPTMLAAKADTTRARNYSGQCETSLHVEQGQRLGELRRTRHRVSFFLSAGSRSLDIGKHRRASIAAARAGSDQQRRSLRAWKPALGPTSATGQQYATQCYRRMGLLCRRVAIYVPYCKAASTERIDAQGNLEAGSNSGKRKTQALAHDSRAARVFDILNAGPRHRFTVSGRLVHNCGFGGSVGALNAMALSYRIHLEPAEARRIVDTWRQANPWAPAFWNALWDAAMSAWELPGQITTAGRLAFVYRDDYLGGALFMALPSGRLLTYPRPRWRDVDVLNKDKKPTGEKRRELSFRRAHGRAKLWHGTLLICCAQR